MIQEMSVDILPCPTYEGGSVFLNGFSDGPKPYEEVLTFLRKGTDMLKYGRLGAPKSHPFRLSNDMTELQWESKKGQVRRIPLKCICRLEQGQNSSVFRKYPKPESQHVSFSIHYTDESKRSRTLDVICNSKHDYEMWYWGVQIIMHYPPTTFYSTPPQALPAARTHALSSTFSAPAVTQHRATPQPAVVNNLLASVRTLPTAGDRRPKATPKTKPMAASLDLMKSMRSSGAAMGISQTDTRAQMGDLYAWGSLMVVEADEQSSSPGNPSASHESLRVVMQSNRPNLVGEANCVDVARVACAPRHAALITRNGELYTWGLGRDGNLGHGWCGNVPKPRLLTRMGGRGVRTVSCGEGASAAISAGQRLFMWGKGTAGQLGNGYAFPCAEPAPVVFPGLREDVKVLAVSCGPYHTAAITEGGLLYTWGNGLFGRLGHGSHKSEYRPRRVMELEDKCIIDVSCGYWHTAAVARPRSSTRSRPASLTPSMEFVTPASTPGAQPHPFRHLPTTASVPNMSTAGDGVEDGSRGELSLRIRSRTADMSSSGSDLQGAVAAAAASVNAARAHVRGSYGGGDPSSSNAGPSVGYLRDEMTSCSVASFDKLPDVASEDFSESLPGAAGILFTWGGDSSWMDSGKRDKHFGCLGLGDDTEGRLAPTRVRGDMDKHGVVQVVCGWSMTIALSADGRVYQMGSTGAHTTDKNCTWEGAKIPTRVDGNLFGMFVEEVACGMRHVVAVASKVQANGQIPDDQRRVRLLAWGCGAEGQLGLWGMGTSTDASVAVRAAQTDHSLPQIVGCLDGRRVLHIAAGGNLTMAVMEHDSRTRRSNPGPSAMPAPTNHFGSSTTSTPSGGGAHSRTLSVAQYQSVVGGFATGVRDASSAAAFQISQSLPITVAAAGLQSLQQMVSGGVGSRSKGGTPTAPPDVSFMPRRRPSRVVGIPQLTFGQPRSDHHHHRHRSDLRRSTTRLLTSYQGFSGQVVQKALSSGGQEGKMLDATASASSGIVSQRSSPPLGQPSEDADSRSASPTSTSLFEISNVGGDFQPSLHVRSAVLETRARSNSVGSAVTGASFATVAAAAVASFARPLQRRGSSGNAADIQSLGDNSTGDTPETDTDSYAHGGRSLDMVPEQSEESPGSPSPISRHSHHAMTTAHPHPHHPMAATIAGAVAGVGGVHPHSHPYSMEGREMSTMAVQVKPPAAVKPRLSRLAQQGPAGAAGTAVAATSTALPDGSIGETARSSVSTMDSSYTAEGSASSELSPSGIITASPETPAGEMDSVHPAVAGIPTLPLPFTLPEAQLPASPPGPQQHLPFASHLMALTPPSPQQHQQQQPTTIQASPLPPAGPPSRHGSLGHVLSPQESLARAQAAAGGAVTPASGSSGRNRDTGVNMWVQAPLAAAGGAAGHSSFRSEGTMRAYGMAPDSVAPSTTVGGHAAMNMPVGAGHRSAGSRGHSRHASYDSVDNTSRDADGIGHHGSNVAVGVGGGGGGGGGFDPRAAVFPAYGVASTSGPLRSGTDPLTANLLQQNEQLQKELEALRQQVALLTHAAGLVPAGASGTGMLPAGGHPYSASSSIPPPAQQQQISAAAAGAAAVAGVAAVAVHNSPLAMAGGGGLQPYPGGAGPLPTSFLNDSANGHGAGNSGQSAFSPQGPVRPAMLHHAHSGGVNTPTVGVSSPGHSFAAGQGTSRSPPTIDRQASVASAPPPVSVPPPSHRHKRSSSIDVSSLIATRDGIGPAKEYLAPVPQPAPAPSLPPNHAGERMPSMGWESTAVGSHSAPPALESLRQAQAGVSLPQAALDELAEEDCLEEGYEGEEDDQEEGEPAVDESLGPSASIDGLGSVTLAVALPMATQGSLHRQLYVAQQQRPPQQQPQLPPQQQLQPQQGPTNRPSASNPGHSYTSNNEDPPSDSVTSLKDGPVRPISENSYRSSESGDGSSYTASAVEGPASALAFPSAVQEADVSLTAAAASAAAGGGGGAGPIWRTRRNAFVEWVNTMHHEMTEEMQNGGGGAGGNVGAVPGHGTIAGGSGAGAAPGGEQLFPAGSSVPLAPVAETLPPEGMQFQYAPGVFITIKPPAQKGGRIQLVKVRFNRKMFTEPSQGQAWWSLHRANLSDLYHVTFDMVNKSAAPLPPGLPPLAPGPHQPVPTATMHVRGMSTDTQGTSAGSTAASASSSLYFSVPAGNSPVQGFAATGNGGCAGSGVPATVTAAVPFSDGRTMWISGASVLAGSASGGGDLHEIWTDVSYDDTAMMTSPAPQPSVGVMGPTMPPRHHRSRSGSRTASGGSSHASASRLGQAQCPESPVLALQQVGTSAAYPGPGAMVAAAAQPHHPSHQRTRSGGGTPNMA